MDPLRSFRSDILVAAAPLLLEGLRHTVVISFISFVFAVLLGIFVGIGRAQATWARRLLAPYVEIFRGTPLLIQLFFLYYGLPSVGIKLDSGMASIIGLGLNGAAYISEIIRGALASVEKGQLDAARALGFSWMQGMIHVVLPQALRVALPPLVNAFSSLLKDSSLVSILAITELTRMSQLIYTRTFRAFEVYLAVGILYFLLTAAVSATSRRLERRFHVGGRVG
ncbi:MAG: amino acid ABC transporter permease [Desulfacinum sp.]|nr:amino acid ABC transporter permease [Desulfacinum sp.]